MKYLYMDLLSRPLRLNASDIMLSGVELLDYSVSLTTEQALWRQLCIGFNVSPANTRRWPSAASMVG